jgi:hypothetical protein
MARKRYTGRTLQRHPAQGSSQCRVVHFNQTGSGRHRNLAETVQSHPPASGFEHASTGARDSIKKWYIERGLYITVSHEENTALKILGSPDDCKFRSCLTFIDGAVWVMVIVVPEAINLQRWKLFIVLLEDFRR